MQGIIIKLLVSNQGIDTNKMVLKKNKKYWEQNISFRSAWTLPYYTHILLDSCICCCLFFPLIRSLCHFFLGMGKWTIVCVFWRVKWRVLSETDTPFFDVLMWHKCNAFPTHMLWHTVPYSPLPMSNTSSCYYSRSCSSISRCCCRFFLVSLYIIHAGLHFHWNRSLFGCLVRVNSCIFVWVWASFTVVLYIGATVVASSGDITFHNVADVIVNAVSYLSKRHGAETIDKSRGLKTRHQNTKRAHTHTLTHIDAHKNKLPRQELREQKPTTTTWCFN